MGDRPQNKNLIPQAHKLTAEEASRGGKASGIARSRNARIKRIAQTMGDAQVPKGKLRDQLAKAGVADEDLDWNAAVIAGVKNKAISGDSKAADMWFGWQADDETQSDDASERSLAIMRANFWPNVSSNFGQICVWAIKHSATHYDMYGGRGSTKSSVESLLGLRLVMEHTERHGLGVR